MLSFLVAFFAISFASTDVGFSRGNSFQEIELRGDLRVFCSTPSGAQSAFAYCRERFLSPSDYDYFVGPQGVDADKVVLTRIDGRGKEIKKSKDYINGKSKSGFNLWISTLLQKPLLDLGTNEVRYTLSKDDQVVAEGEFTAEVTTGAVRTCRPYVFHSNGTTDCSMPQNLCNQYFAIMNYCR